MRNTDAIVIIILLLQFIVGIILLGWFCLRSQRKDYRYKPNKHKKRIQKMLDKYHKDHV